MCYKIYHYWMFRWAYVTVTCNMPFWAIFDLFTPVARGGGREINFLKNLTLPSKEAKFTPAYQISHLSDALSRSNQW